MKDVVVQYTHLQSGDESKFTDLVLLFHKEFESPDPTLVNAANIKKLLTNPHFVCIIAQIGDKVVGGLTAYELERYDGEGSSMYLYDLAVCASYQRNGIGSRLVRELMEDCRSKGIRDLFVQADAEDRHALAFYKQIGGAPSETFHFTFSIAEA